MSLDAANAAKRERLLALDGLRGVAALAVFFYHSIAFVPVPDAARPWIDWTPLGPLFNGPGAVHVFFVLSGLVLTLSLQADTGRGRLPRYWVRRVFRIHPPYVVAVLIAWAANAAIGATALFDPELGWRRVPAWRLPVALAFPSMAFGLLPVGWSLFVELAMSAVFPLLFWLGRRLHPCVPLLVALLFLGDLDPRFVFLRFTIDFAIGIALALEADRVGRAMRALPRFVPALAACAGLVMLQLPLMGALARVGYTGLERGHTPDAVAMFAIGAALLIIGTLHSARLHRWLASAPARFLGRISYSFYLVHHTILIVLVMLARGAGGSLEQLLVACILALLLSLLAGELGWRFVEAPSIRAGRALIRASGSLFRRAGLA